MKPFKLIVAGGRDFKDMDLFLKTMQQVEQELAEYSVSLVSGMAKGADLKSRGTKHMIETMEDQGKPVCIVKY